MSAPKQNQPLPIPVGATLYQDIVRQIEQQDGLRSTGFHFQERPADSEIARIAATHYGRSWDRVDGATLVARHVVPSFGTAGWTIFGRPLVDGGDGQ